MKEFLLAIQFLTVIPLKVKDAGEKALSRSVIYFPLAGLLLGAVLAGTNILLFHFNFPDLFINVALVVLLIALTGGIHLDGLADTTDALLSGKDREGMLMVMRDSHIGVMGVLSLISIILLKIALLSSLNFSLKTNALFLTCILSRWSMVFAMFLFPYARQEGKAKIYIDGMNSKIFIYSTLIACSLVFMIWKIKGLLIFLITSVCCYLIARQLNKKIDGITGDTLGAINELMEVASLFFIFIIHKGGL